METVVKSDTKEVGDRGENVAAMEPLLISDTSRHRPQLNDLAVELASKAAGFRHSLPDGVRTALADLVRSMNCYYSNLIEGHDTHPVDIERALNNDYSNDEKKRDLQREAKAHITVQKWIDEGDLAGKSTTMSFCGSSIPKAARGFVWCQVSYAPSTLKLGNIFRSVLAQSDAS